MARWIVASVYVYVLASLLIVCDPPTQLRPIRERPHPCDFTNERLPGIEPCEKRSDLRPLPQPLSPEISRKREITYLVILTGVFGVLQWLLIKFAVRIDFLRGSYRA